MAPNDNTFEITARTIDFGDRVVAVSHIAFAASQKGRPFKVLGVFLIAVAIAGIGYEALLGAGISTLNSGGSSRIWATFVLAGLGIFGLVYQRRALVIGLSDSSKIHLSGGSSAFQQRVVGCIGEAMAADAMRVDNADNGPPFHVAIDMQAEIIEGAPEAVVHATTVERQHPPAQTHIPAQAAIPPTLPQQATQPPGAQPHAHMSGAPYRNGRHAPLDTLETRLNPNNPTLRAGPPSNGAIEVPRVGDPPSWPNSSMGGARPAREPSNPIRDLEALTLFVKQSDIQHKVALLDLLTVVDDYLKGGGTIREDAVAHWQSFAGYVHQYLASIDGLVPLTDRAGRPFAVH